MTNATPYRPVSGMIVYLSHAEVIALINTAERIPENHEIFKGKDQAQDELETFLNISRAIGSKYNPYSMTEAQKNSIIHGLGLI